jgi:hypothetical protein
MESDTQPATDGKSVIEARDRLQTRKATIWFWAGLLVALLLPNRWTGNASIHPWAHDIVAYQKVAAAAPDLPAGHIASAHAERFVPHYLVGLLSDLTGLSLHASYRIAALACIAATLLVAERIFANLRPPWWIYALGLSLFALAPYSLREVILMPGSFTDLVFVLGVGLVLLGLLRVRFSLVLFGALVALSGRQTALLFAAAAACWILFAPEWREHPLRTRLAEAAGMLITLGGVYLVIKAVTKSFSIHFAPDSPSDTIIFGPPSVHHLITHLARCADPILVPGAALATVLVILASAGLRARDLPMRFWLCLLLCAAIVIQPIVINPDFPGFSNNEQRLAGLGLLPLCVALAIALIEADRRRLILPSPALVAAGLGLIFVASLHHIFTIVGPSNVRQFAAIQIIAALLLAAGLIYAHKTTPARLAEAPSSAG